jgi:hypothetical protein
MLITTIFSTIISTMWSFVDLDRTFGSQPRELGAALARIDTGKGQERLFQDQKPCCYNSSPSTRA